MARPGTVTIKFSDEERLQMAASAALTGLLSRSSRTLDKILDERQRYARAAVMIAEAMLDELDGNQAYQEARAAKVSSENHPAREGVSSQK